MERIGSYKIIQKINEGGMGEIYKAFDAEEKVVAVKKIRPEFSRDEIFKKMLLDEAKISVALSHPNVLKIFNIGRTPDNCFYMAMEFINGCNLWEIMKQLLDKKKKFPVDTAIQIISKILQGLGYAHALKDKNGQNLDIVHQDINPPNIMLSIDGRVKVADFGIAKAKNSVYNNRTDILKGKYSYMSPEQAGGKEVDKQTDIFAVGVVFWEILTLTKLFKYSSPEEALQIVQKCDVPKPSFYNPSINSKLEKIVLKALEKKKENRYQTCEDFNFDLLNYFSEIKKRGTVISPVDLIAAIWPEKMESGSNTKQFSLEDDIEKEQYIPPKKSILSKLFAK